MESLRYRNGRMAAVVRGWLRALHAQLGAELLQKAEQPLQGKRPGPGEREGGHKLTWPARLTASELSSSGSWPV